MRGNITKAVAAFAPLLAIGVAGTYPASADSFVSVRGKCQKIVYGRDNLTPYCKPAMVSSTFGPNNVLFHWALIDGMLLTVASTDLPNPSAHSDATKITHLSIKGGAISANATVAATGKCTFGDPYKGKTTISCKGKAGGKRFEFVFQTDGRKPKEH